MTATTMRMMGVTRGGPRQWQRPRQLRRQWQRQGKTKMESQREKQRRRRPRTQSPLRTRRTPRDACACKRRGSARRARRRAPAATLLLLLLLFLLPPRRRTRSRLPPLLLLLVDARAREMRRQGTARARKPCARFLLSCGTLSQTSSCFAAASAPPPSRTNLRRSSRLCRCRGGGCGDWEPSRQHPQQHQQQRHDAMAVVGLERGTPQRARGAPLSSAATSAFLLFKQGEGREEEGKNGSSVALVRPLGRAALQAGAASTQNTCRAGRSSSASSARVSACRAIGGL